MLGGVLDDCRLDVCERTESGALAPPEGLASLATPPPLAPSFLGPGSLAVLPDLLRNP